MSRRAPVRLTGMAWDHPRAMGPLLGTMAAYRTIRPWVEVVWRARSLRDFGDQPLEAMATQFDLILIDHPFVGQAARTGSLRPFDELLPDGVLEERSRASIGATYRSYSWQGRQWALPIDAAAQVMAYRPDLLPAGATTPATWAETIRMAGDLGQAGRWMAVPLGPTDIVPTFYTLANGLGAAPFGSREHVLPRDDGLQALSLLDELRRACHSGSLELDPPRVLDRMSDGDDIALAPIVFGYSNYARAGFRRTPVQFADLPTAKGDHAGSTLGGVGIAVTAASKAPAEAAAYAVFLTAGELQRSAYVALGGQPAHRSAWEDPAADRVSGTFLSATARTQELAWVRARFPGYNRFQERAGIILHAFVRGTVGTSETLDWLDEAYRAALVAWSGPLGADPTIRDR